MVSIGELRRSKRALSRQGLHSRQTTSQAASSVPASLVQRAANPQALQAQDMLYLQRALGNRAVSELLTTHWEPRAHHGGRMHVNAAGDQFEKEADRMAKEVTSSHDTSSHATSHAANTLQRSPEAPRVGAEGGPIDRDLERRIQSAKGGGSPVPENIRRKMTETTGADFRGVRVHNNKEAHALSSELGAKAATHGKDIFLGRGQSPHDVQLMAHELTHTIQQGAVGAPRDANTLPEHKMAAPAIQRTSSSEKRRRKMQARRAKMRFKAGRLSEEELKSRIKIAKAKGIGLKALDWLLTAPLRLIDEASIVDRHIKDLYNYARTGKTRKQRHKDKHKVRSEGTAIRQLGRTGLRGYLSGISVHKILLDKHDRTGGEMPWQGKLNPFTQLGWGVSNQQTDLEIYQNELRNRREQAGAVQNAPQNDLDNEDSSIVDSSSSETSSEDSEALDLEWLFGDQDNAKEESEETD